MVASPLSPSISLRPCTERHCIVDNQSDSDDVVHVFMFAESQAQLLLRKGPFPCVLRDTTLVVALLFSGQASILLQNELGRTQSPPSVCTLKSACRSLITAYLSVGYL